MAARSVGEVRSDSVRASDQQTSDWCHFSVRLAGGRSADVDLIAPRAGRYPARCSHLMHAALGMAGEVVVE